MYESFSRALERRKYRRLEPSSSPGFVVQPKRVKVAHLAAGGKIRRRGGHRLRLRCFSLRFLQPGRLMAAAKAAAAKLMQVGKAGKLEARGAIIASTPPPPFLLLPSNRPLRSSGNDVIDEVWFQNALRRSIAEGRLPI